MSYFANKLHPKSPLIIVIAILKILDVTVMFLKAGRVERYLL